MLMTILVFLLVLSILVFVHEFGHFIVARCLGVGVERFSIGFGPKLFGWTMGRTEYRFSAIPLGGYVKMVGEQHGTEIDPEDLPFSFTHKPTWKRLLIVTSGPAFNLFFAVLLFWGLAFTKGLPYLDPVIGEMGADSPAMRAGLQTGDWIKKVNGKEIRSWEGLVKSLHKIPEGKEVFFEIERSEKKLEKVLLPVKRPFPDPLGGTEMRMSIGADPYLSPVIGYVQKGSPAENAGLLPQDRILSINGKAIDSWIQVGPAIRDLQDTPFVMDVERNNTFLSFNLKAAKEKVDDGKGGTVEIYLIGVLSLSFENVHYPNLWHSMLWSWEKCYEITHVTVVAVARMIKGKISSKDNLGGPIMIAQITGQEARKGALHLISFIGIISVSLALINLLPIPVLDGGHIFFYLIELVRRKPVPIEIQEKAQMVGLSLLLLLMVFVFYNDIMRIISS